jgi:hypothetical protein
MREPLLFSGIRWLGAKVVARKPVVDDDPDHRGRKVPFVDTLIIETSGKGRPYQVHFAEAWWRDLAELALDDEKRVLSFLRRRGDPFGVLAPGGKQISTYDWRSLKAVLERAVVAWDTQPDETGVSHFRLEKLRSAEHMFDMATGVAATGWASEIEAGYHGGITLTHRAKVLTAYLCAAAAASVRGGLDMRRCDYCSSWFNLHYANARQCSSSCRAAASNKGRHPMASFARSEHVKGRSVGKAAGGAGENGRLQDGAELRDRKQAAAHAAQIARSNAAASATAPT